LEERLSTGEDPGCPGRGSYGVSVKEKGERGQKRKAGGRFLRYVTLEKGRFERRERQLTVQSGKTPKGE